MVILASLLMLVGGIGSLVCFIMVLVQMFKRGENTLGIVCIILALCTGIGSLIAFVYGWIKSGQWGLKNIMLAWTGSLVAYIIGLIMYFAAVGPAGLNQPGGFPAGFTPQEIEEQVDIQFDNPQP